MGGLSLTLFSISATAHFAFLIVLTTPSLCTTESNVHVCGQTGTIAYTTGMISLYSLFYCRLRTVFKNTHYSVSSASFYLFLFTSFLLLIPIPIICYYYIIWHTNATLFFGVWQILYGLFSIILSMSFIIKSLKFINSFKSKEQTLLKPVVKYSILFIIALLSSLMEVFIFVYRWKLNDDWMLLIANTVLVISDNVINIICLFFQFPFAQIYYDKYCCGKCIKCIVIKSSNLPMDRTEENVQLSSMNETGDNGRSKSTFATTGTTTATNTIDTVNIAQPQFNRDVTKFRVQSASNTFS
eukprot:110169_1